MSYLPQHLFVSYRARHFEAGRMTLRTRCNGACAPHTRKSVSVYFIYALTLFNSIGVSSAQMVLPLYALDLGASPFAVGMLAATYSICPTLLAVTSGKLIDRVGARW